MWISLSLKYKISDFHWYTFQGSRSVTLDNANKKYDLELSKGEVYGLRLGKTHFWIAQFDDESGELIEFKLIPKEARRIVDKSNGYSGKVNNKKVVAGIYGKDSSTTGKPTKNIPSHATPIKNSKPTENKLLTQSIKKVKFPGLSKIKHVLSQKAVEGELYHYYNISDTVSPYRRKHKLNVRQLGNWASDLEDVVEKTLGSIDVEIGTVRWKGDLIKVMVVIQLE
jgi:hypothetical protein